MKHFILILALWLTALAGRGAIGGGGGVVIPGVGVGNTNALTAAQQAILAAAVTNAINVSALKQYDGSLFGITESYKQANGTAAVIAGSNLITNNFATFSSGDVGKVMLVTGAGIGGLDLVGAITSVPATNVVQLNTSASTTIPAGYCIEWGFDDSVAVQNALTWVVTNSNPGGLIVLTNACVINGPLNGSNYLQGDIYFSNGFGNWPTNHNSQLYFPDGKADASGNLNPIAVGFMGTSATVYPRSASNPDFHFLAMNAGLVSFLSTTNGGDLIDCRNTTLAGGWGNVNNIVFVSRNSQFRTAPNGNMTALNLLGATGMDIATTVIDKGWTLYNSPNTVYNISNNIGLISPAGLNGGCVVAAGINPICGYGTGFTVADHTAMAANIQPLSCHNAIVVEESGKQNVIFYCDAADCAVYINTLHGGSPYSTLSAFLSTENNSSYSNRWTYPGILETNCVSEVGNIFWYRESGVGNVNNLLKFDPNTRLSIYLVDPWSGVPVTLLTPLSVFGNATFGGTATVTNIVTVESGLANGTLNLGGDNNSTGLTTGAANRFMGIFSPAQGQNTYNIADMAFLSDSSGNTLQIGGAGYPNSASPDLLELMTAASRSGTGLHRWKVDSAGNFLPGPAAGTIGTASAPVSTIYISGGETGPTNATPPANAITPVAWRNFTNSTGGTFKLPLYQ